MRQFKTSKDIGIWIANNAPVDSNTTIEEAIIWFVSMQEATIWYECNRIKDWAHVICNGLPPVDLEYTDSWLNDQYECWEEEEYKADEQIIIQLKNHFGV